MAEASGFIILKAPAEILSNLQESNEEIDWENTLNLFEFAGIPEEEVSNTAFEYHKGSNLRHEGVLERDGYLKIKIFGEEWMTAMSDLARNGRNIEVFGYIYHEYDFWQSYYLDEKGLHHVKQEDDGGVTVESNMSNLDDDVSLSDLIPKKVKEIFPENFPN